MYSDISKNLWMTHTMMAKHLDNALGTIHGIGLTEYMVLQALSEAPNNIMRRVDLAESIGRTASGITRMLMPMEKIGLIKKESNKRDARVSLVKLTPAGERLLSDAAVTFEQKSEQLLKNLNQKQLETFNKILQGI
ncbi:MAG: MarR family transcriptional regulator [Cellvibrionaceae bacterium]